MIITPIFKSKKTEIEYNAVKQLCTLFDSIPMNDSTVIIHSSIGHAIHNILNSSNVSNEIEQYTCQELGFSIPD